MDIKMPILPEMCKDCKLKERLLQAINLANEAGAEATKSQKYYDEQISEVNKTLAKYTRKIDELDKE